MDGIAVEDERHAAARLLPWYVNDTLTANERAVVEAHLHTCAACREVLTVERRIAAMPAAPVPSPDAGWGRVAARLDRGAAAAPSRRSARPWLRSDRGAGRPVWLRRIVAAQFLVIIGLGGWTMSQTTRPTIAPAADYHVLGADSGTRTGNVLAMFRPGTTEAELRRMLTDSSARLVDGPTSGGAYVLAVPGGADGAPLAALRRQPAVTMAEPIGTP